MFTFNKLTIENVKKKELNKQHISSFLCISVVFLLLKTAEELWKKVGVTQKRGETALKHGEAIHRFVHLESGEAVCQTLYVLRVVQGVYSLIAA